MKTGKLLEALKSFTGTQQYFFHPLFKAFKYTDGVKDMKSTTFNIHKTRAKDIHAISNLVMLAAFSIILFTKIAIKYENSPHREFIHRVRGDQKINSFITFARDFINYCLEEDIDFFFSFQFSKNSS